MPLSVRHFGQLVGESAVSDMAKKFGLSRPLSVRDMIESFGLPLQQKLSLCWLEGSFPKKPVCHPHPPDWTYVPVDAQLDWTDPGKGSQRAATYWTVYFKRFDGLPDQVWGQNTPGHLGFNLNFGSWYRWSVVPENEFGTGPSSPSFAFQTEPYPYPPSPPSPPSPPPPPTPPPNLVGISKLSLFNCQIERHTVYVWVRDVTRPVSGPWKQVQIIPTQFNERGQCPYDENQIPADAEAILTRNGEGGGLVCTNGDIYQVSIVDPERPTCDGRNDPEIGNCVVEDRPSFFKFTTGGGELTVMLENGRLSPVQNP